MTTSVRDKVFETNSSSSHSVTVAEGEILDRGFDRKSIRNGIVTLEKPPCEYDEWKRFYKPENILTFLIVAEVEARQFEEAGRDRLHFRAGRKGKIDILPALCERYANVKAAIDFLGEEYGLSFRMMMEPDDEGFFDTGDLGFIEGYLGDPEKLRQVLFCSGSYVQTTEENGWHQETVPTDIGTVVDTGIRYDAIRRPI
ncbi:hypothetical protein G6L37_04650 [Agrobacterium rubi]|nr:hypothetical protein [Agrobacterium rubi]NTF24643.1 hypothetical protein [Agrobacterium rubi]